MEKAEKLLLAARGEEPSSSRRQQGPGQRIPQISTEELGQREVVMANPDINFDRVLFATRTGPENGSITNATLGVSALGGTAEQPTPIRTLWLGSSSLYYHNQPKVAWEEFQAMQNRLKESAK